MEEWAPIEEFPKYSVNIYGAVRRKNRLLALHQNSDGTVYVALWKNNRQYNRSVPLLVARAFLPPPTNPYWDTLIYLNGNRADMHFENLMWRPRQFASQYHYQINLNLSATDQVRDVHTGECGTVRAICSRYGLLPNDVFIQAWNYTRHGDYYTTVLPTGQQFEMI